MLPYVTDHTDHSCPVSAAIAGESRANRIAILPQSPSQRLVDQNGRYAIRPVLRIEQPAANQRHADRVEIVLTHDAKLGARQRLVRDDRPAFDQERLYDWLAIIHWEGER